MWFLLLIDILQKGRGREFVSLNLFRTQVLSFLLQMLIELNLVYLANSVVAEYPYQMPIASMWLHVSFADAVA